jgi:hypothetical protein
MKAKSAAHTAAVASSYLLGGLQEHSSLLFAHLYTNFLSVLFKFSAPETRKEEEEM